MFGKVLKIPLGRLCNKFFLNKNVLKSIRVRFERLSALIVNGRKQQE